LIEPALPTFEEECIHFWGKELTGKFKHYCAEYDYLPIDETVGEFAHCGCFDDDEARQLSRERSDEILKAIETEDCELLHES
jgi:hypothetical protein